MKTTNNTVLITGGSAGIGLAIAKTLAAQGNHVIITGRNKERLENAAAQLNNVTPIVADVASAVAVDALVSRISKEFPALNVVINNAGAAHYYQLGANVSAFDKAAEEIHTNYLSILALNEKLLPLLSKQAEAAIVNVSSIVAFVPARNIPTYAASKAALHSYTQILRYELAQQQSPVKVFELMPPLVNTDFSQAIGGANGIPPQQVADELVQALAEDRFEIHVGGTAQLYQAFLQSPSDALQYMNQAR
ncbi:short-chain dehydrogenase [Chitinophaga parva]|uniref:Short-chain dehydrogenase n=1 Tax=Chitinophaga parva TaxID=2169414 RepID=A0A2T7BCV5_9BACT|nr:SDR family NAD(P)-dependent oxidoreductase [Chitinophaga parva]PUZ22928.1 short-chain dehydrogenase [Chitinophaga parva]